MFPIGVYLQGLRVGTVAAFVTWLLSLHRRNVASVGLNH